MESRVKVSCSRGQAQPKHTVHATREPCQQQHGAVSRACSTTGFVCHGCFTHVSFPSPPHTLSVLSPTTNLHSLSHTHTLSLSLSHPLRQQRSSLNYTPSFAMPDALIDKTGTHQRAPGRSPLQASLGKGPQGLRQRGVQVRLQSVQVNLAATRGPAGVVIWAREHKARCTQGRHSYSRNTACKPQPSSNQAPVHPILPLFPLPHPMLFWGIPCFCKACGVRSEHERKKIEQSTCVENSRLDAGQAHRPPPCSLASGEGTSVQKEAHGGVHEGQ